MIYYDVYLVKYAENSRIQLRPYRQFRNSAQRITPFGVDFVLCNFLQTLFLLNQKHYTLKNVDIVENQNRTLLMMRFHCPQQDTILRYK